MRLINYLNEANYRYSQEMNRYKNSVKKTIKKYLEPVKRDILDYQFPLTLQKLCIILSSYYYNEQIRFIWDGSVHFPSFKYVIGSDFYKNGDIEIFLSEQTIYHILELIEKDSWNKELNDRFFNELIWAICRAKVHANRIKRMKDMFNFVGYNPIKKHLMDYVERYAYISYEELEEDGNSPTKSLYYDMIGHLPIYTKFLELLNQFKRSERERPEGIGLLI